MFALTSFHKTLLLDTFNLWKGEDSDLQIITRDEMKIFTQSKLLTFYAPKLFSMLENNIENKTTICVDEDCKTVLILLNLLKVGKATTDNKAVILEVMEAAKSFGICLENITYTREEKEAVDEKEVPSNISPESFLRGFDELIDNKDGDGDESKYSEASFDCSTNMSKDSFIKRFDDILETNSEKLKLVQNHRSEEIVQEEAVAVDKSMYKCETCGKSFKTKNKLSRHSLCHTSFRCNVCHKGFRMLSMLRRHMTTMHAEEEQEDSSSSENETLMEEVEESTFFESVETNTTINNEDSQLNYECKTCGKSFKTKMKLSRHSLCHTNYKCHVCLKGFRMSSMLQRHVLTMHREQFRCDLCEKKFPSSSLLRKHTLNRHSIVQAKQTLSSENLLGLKSVLV